MTFAPLGLEEGARQCEAIVFDFPRTTLEKWMGTGVPIRPHHPGAPETTGSVARLGPAGPAVLALTFRLATVADAFARTRAPGAPTAPTAPRTTASFAAAASFAATAVPSATDALCAELLMQIWHMHLGLRNQ